MIHLKLLGWFKFKDILTSLLYKFQLCAAALFLALDIQMFINQI